MPDRPVTDPDAPAWPIPPLLEKIGWLRTPAIMAERDAALAEVTRLREALTEVRSFIGSFKQPLDDVDAYHIGSLLDAALAEGSDVLPTGGAE